MKRSLTIRWWALFVFLGGPADAKAAKGWAIVSFMSNSASQSRWGVIKSRTGVYLNRVKLLSCLVLSPKSDSSGKGSSRCTSPFKSLSNPEANTKRSEADRNARKKKFAGRYESARIKKAARAFSRAALKIAFVFDYFLKNFFLPKPANPTNPMPRSNKVVGSGTGALVMVTSI